MGFDALAYAQQFRDICREIARREINLLRPKPSLATVTAIDAPNGKCSVQFPGETSSVPIRMFTVQPRAVGCVVRVEGEPGLRYVTDVVSGGAVIQLTASDGKRFRISVSNTGTVTSTAV